MVRLRRCTRVNLDYLVAAKKKREEEENGQENAGASSQSIQEDSPGILKQVPAQYVAETPDLKPKTTPVPIVEAPTPIPPQVPEEEAAAGKVVTAEPDIEVKSEEVKLTERVTLENDEQVPATPDAETTPIPIPVVEAPCSTQETTTVGDVVLAEPICPEVKPEETVEIAETTCEVEQEVNTTETHDSEIKSTPTPIVETPSSSQSREETNNVITAESDIVVEPEETPVTAASIDELQKDKYLYESKSTPTPVVVTSEPSLELPEPEEPANIAETVDELKQDEHVPTAAPNFEIKSTPSPNVETPSSSQSQEAIRSDKVEVITPAPTSFEFPESDIVSKPEGTRVIAETINEKNKDLPKSISCPIPIVETSSSPPQSEEPAGKIIVAEPVSKCPESDVVIEHEEGVDNTETISKMKQDLHETPKSRIPIAEIPIPSQSQEATAKVITAEPHVVVKSEVPPEITVPTFELEQAKHILLKTPDSGSKWTPSPTVKSFIPSQSQESKEVTGKVITKADAEPVIDSPESDMAEPEDTGELPETFYELQGGEDLTDTASASAALRSILSPILETPTSSQSQESKEVARKVIIAKPIFNCPESDVVVKPEETPDITGTIYELEQDEVSTPKGRRRGKLTPTPMFPMIPYWIQPEVLLEEMWQKRRVLRFTTDDESLFVFPGEGKNIMNADKWEIPELMKLKASLNNTKSLLDHLPLEEWHNHTKKMNISFLVMSYVKRYFNPEFVSVAWAKFFEIMAFYPIIPNMLLEQIKKGDGRQKVTLDTLHLCEAPGAFISALNHLLKTNHKEINWNWLATTLNPYHEGNDISTMINDDRLILQSYDNWTFLEDSTGNILDSANLKHLVKKCEAKMKPSKGKKSQSQSEAEEEGVMIITADGSVDCQSNPSEQERSVAHLHFGEIVTALSLLRVGGTFVLKIFTFLEAPTICHLYLLSCVFNEVQLYKPTVSKEGNSEVYVICLGFRGKASILHVMQSKLVGKLETFGNSLDAGKVLLPLEDIPKFFIERIKEAAGFFCGYQMKIIMRNRSTFGCDTRMYQLMKPYRKEAVEQWIENCHLQPLPSKMRLFCDDDKLATPCHLDFRKEQGCFADKAFRASGSVFEKLNYLSRELSSYVPWRGTQNYVLYGAFLKVGPAIFEKPYRNIRCSRFCLGSLLGDREELRDIVKPFMQDMVKQGLTEINDYCKGHDKKRVHHSMAKSCDVDIDELEIMCFNKLTYDFVRKTDFEHQQKDLIELFEQVNNKLGKGRSIFLCRYQMLSRLQVGLIFCLASVFEKVIIYGDASKQIVGILLYKFIGLTRPELKNMMQSISDIFQILVDVEFNLPVLQLVPMQALVEHMPCEFLVKYNILIINQDLQRSLAVVKSLIMARGK